MTPSNDGQVLSGESEVELVLVFDEDNDKIEISTAERINGSMIPIAEIELGWNEPMESLQRRYADQIVQRWNAFPDLAAALKALKAACEANPAMQGRQYVDLGIQVNNAIAKAGA